MNAMEKAVRAEQAAEKAVLAYDAYIFGSVGRAFDAFKANMLAEEAAERLAVASRLATRAQRNGVIDARRAAEFRAIAS